MRLRTPSGYRLAATPEPRLRQAGLRTRLAETWRGRPSGEAQAGVRVIGVGRLPATFFTCAGRLPFREPAARRWQMQLSGASKTFRPRNVAAAFGRLRGAESEATATSRT